MILKSRTIQSRRPFVRAPHCIFNFHQFFVLIFNILYCMCIQMCLLFILQHKVWLFIVINVAITVFTRFFCDCAAYKYLTCELCVCGYCKLCKNFDHKINLQSAIISYKRIQSAHLTNSTTCCCNWWWCFRLCLFKLKRTNSYIKITANKDKQQIRIRAPYWWM